MKKNLTGTIIGGILAALGLTLSIIGFTSYTPVEKINGDDPYFPFILWGIFALLIGVVVFFTGIARLNQKEKAVLRRIPSAGEK